MKMRVISLVLVVASIALVGCGGDPPTADLNAAKQALDAARAEGAERFASSEYSAAQSAYNQAESTVNTEAEKLFKNFDQAVQQIADAKTKADRSKASAASEKGRQKGSAEGVISAAQAAISAALASLDEAPAGKGTEADIEQLRADLSSAEADLSAARWAARISPTPKPRPRAPNSRPPRYPAACRWRCRSTTNWSRRCAPGTIASRSTTILHYRRPGFFPAVLYWWTPLWPPSYYWL